MSTVYHPVVRNIRALLDERGCTYETFEHEPVRTSEEAAKVRTGYTIEQGAKALITRVKEAGRGKRFVMFVVPGNKRFNEKKVRELFCLCDLRFATEAEVAEITGGVIPGGVPPFGNLFGLEVFADESVFKNERIIFNAGDRRYSIGMFSSDYASLVSPRRGEFAE